MVYRREARSFVGKSVPGSMEMKKSRFVGWKAKELLEPNHTNKSRFFKEENGKRTCLGKRSTCIIFPQDANDQRRWMRHVRVCRQEDVQASARSETGPGPVNTHPQFGTGTYVRTLILILQCCRQPASILIVGQQAVGPWLGLAWHGPGSSMFGQWQWPAAVYYSVVGTSYLRLFPHTASGLLRTRQPSQPALCVSTLAQSPFSFSFLVSSTVREPAIR